VGYSLIPLLAAIALGFHFVVIVDASPRSKAIIGGMVVLSLVLFFRIPRYLVVATLLQVAASIYVLVYLKLRPWGV
jgi:hypothetical protein